MTAQAKVDVEFINQILNSHGKKTNNPFLLNRLDKAISQLEKNNLIEGVSARADYLQYINEYDEALDLINFAIRKYGFREALLMIKIKILSHLGNWNLLKPAWEEFFIYSNSALQELYSIIYLTHTLIYLDNDYPAKFKLYENLNFYKENIQYTLKVLADTNITLTTYQKFLQILHQNIYGKYSLESLKFKLRFYDDILQIIITSEFWDTNDLKQLYQEVNEAILAIDDVDFQIEADNIEIIFINFPIENLPQDFRLDNDDDNDLIDIVSKRMQNPEEEMVKIEVENV